MTFGDRLRYLLVTGLGTGCAPVAPGTVGTLPGVALGLLLQRALPPHLLAPVLGAVAVVLLLVGCSTSAFVDRVLQREDPPEFVLDEIVGYLGALAMLAALAPPSLAGHAAAFALFRLFDITKPPPVRQLERLHGAPGIMLDDAMAGIYAGLGLIGLFRADVI